MKINFLKYHGTGNDFILIDNRDNSFPISNTTIAKICHRRFGIGADGLILLEKSSGYDFKMRYFNSDGNEGSMCGNGGRCIVAFAKHLGIISESTKFMAVDGVHEAYINSENMVKLKMQDINLIKDYKSHLFLNTGSPHVVVFICDHKDFDTYTEGKKIRYSENYRKEGTNVNFVSIINKNTIKVSTYERGVEDETYSCGTGCVAAAISTAFKQNNQNNIELSIQTKGGNLKVYSQKIDNEIFINTYLEGHAELVFSGCINS